MFRTETEKKGKKTSRVLIYGGMAFCRYEVTKMGFRPFGRKKVEQSEKKCQIIALRDSMRKHIMRTLHTAEVMAMVENTKVFDTSSYGYSEVVIRYVRCP